MLLAALATRTTGQEPAEMAAVNTDNLPKKPAVSGLPAIESRKNANTPATTGEPRARHYPRGAQDAPPPAPPAMATRTTGQEPADMTEVNTAHLPMKPAVSGMPAIESRKNANTPATSGERRPRPAHRV